MAKPISAALARDISIGLRPVSDAVPQELIDEARAQRHPAPDAAPVAPRARTIVDLPVPHDTPRSRDYAQSAGRQHQAEPAIADHGRHTPRGQMTARTPALSGDANGSGDIFAGWVIAQMDMASGIRAAERAMGRVATVSISGLSFGAPVQVGDTLCVYTDITRIGNSSMELAVEAWAIRDGSDRSDMVTSGTITLVAIDRDGRPRLVPR